MKVLKCHVCRHPKVKEINEVVLGGMTQADAIRTLAPDLSPASLQYHFANDHQDRDLSEYGPGAPTVATKPAKPGKPAPARTIRTTVTTKRELEDLVKVHWEIPRSLVKKLKHKAIDKEQPTVELARQYIRYGVEHL